MLPFLLPWKNQSFETLINTIYQQNQCGELGIRTPGGLHLNSFQDCRNRPLCQLSGAKIRLRNSSSKICLHLLNYKRFINYIAAVFIKKKLPD